jgi:hypothetical protein
MLILDREPKRDGELRSEKWRLVLGREAGELGNIDCCATLLCKTEAIDPHEPPEAYDEA